MNGTMQTYHGYRSWKSIASDFQRLLVHPIFVVSVLVCLLGVAVADGSTAGAEIADTRPVWYEGTPNHPRLYFTADDIAELQKRAEIEPTKTTWKGMVEAAERLKSFPTSIEDPDAYGKVIAGLRYNSFIYAITGDERAGKAGKEYLLAVCSWPTWVRENRRPRLVDHYSGGIYISVGEAYDWLYPLLSEEERSAVRTSIVEKALMPLHEEYSKKGAGYVIDTRTNRAGQSFGGIGVAALAIQGDDPQLPLEPYWTTVHGVMQEYFDNYDTEGGWSEGVSYQSYGLCDGSGALWYVEALKRVTGEDLYLHPKFAKAYQFPLYLLPPDRLSSSDAFGDQSYGRYSAGVIARLATVHQNGYAQWYYHNVPKNQLTRMDEFLFYNSSVRSKDPDDLPTSILFPDIGWAAIRSGWEKGDLLLAFRSGPVYPGHNRPEQNSFMLDALGERLIIEPSLSSSGYNDPEYRLYYRSTAAQNTILVDGDPQSQEDITVDNQIASAGEIREFITTSFYDAVTGEAARVYRDKLTEFARHIVFVKPDYVVIFDDLEAVRESRFSSLLHAFGRESIEVRGKEVVITQNQVQLHVMIIEPDAISHEMHEGGMVRMDGVDRTTSYVELQTRDSVKSTQFLMVLYPVFKGRSPPLTKEIRGISDFGVQIERKGGMDLVLFSSDGGPIEAGELVTDGDQAYIRYEDGRVTAYAMHNGTTIAYRGTTIYTSKTRTTIAIGPGEEIAQVSPEIPEAPPEDPFARIREVVESFIETISKFFGIGS